MSTKIYKIAERQAFYKYVKTKDVYEERTSFSFRHEEFNTREEAQEKIDEITSNDKPYGIGNCHYEKITDNTYKLSYNDWKGYRMVSYDICEFDTVNVLNDPSDIDKIKHIKTYL